MRRVGVFLLILSAGARAQVFEAASLKPNRSGSGNSSTHNSPGRMVAENNTLRALVLYGFGIPEYRLSAPEWFGTDRYDLNARLPEGARRESVPAMMRALLVERFGLQFHRETRTLPALALVIARGGPKLVRAADGSMSSNSSGNGMYRAKNLPLANLAVHLSTVLERPVLDATGLTGGYDLELTWTPDEVPPEARNGPSLASALQEQVGLRLESRRAPVEILVIDQARRTPVEN